MVILSSPLQPILTSCKRLDTGEESLYDPPLSLCEPGSASRHASVSFGSLTGTSSDSGAEADISRVLSDTETGQDRERPVSVFRRPSFLFQHSVESCSSQATATTETTENQSRRVRQCHMSIILS